MTILTRISLRGDWPDELRRMFPRITLSQVEEFGILADADNIVTDDGEPTKAMLAWCERVAA